MRYYLIGFTGCGKTTLGKKTAKLLNYNFADLDELIEEKSKMDIPNIFKKYGEKYFRDIENSVLEDVVEDNIIISTGGGIIYSKKNIKYMKQYGKIIYLKSELDDILNNLSRVEVDNRPMLNKSYKEIKNLYDTRHKIYDQIYDYKIINKDIDESVSKIKEIIEYNK